MVVDFAERLDAIQEQRGFLEPCRTCPLHLNCAAGKTPKSYWCVRCLCIYIPSLKLRISCDALDVKRAVQNGMCPCISGVPVKTLVGVQIAANAFTQGDEAD